MTESEQAQAIAEIRSAVHGQNKYMSHSLSEATLFLRIARKDRVTLLKIVDSQAQKIAEIERENSELKEEIADMCASEGVIR